MSLNQFLARKENFEKKKQRHKASFTHFTVLGICDLSEYVFIYWVKQTFAEVPTLNIAEMGEMRLSALNAVNAVEKFNSPLWKAKKNKDSAASLPNTLTAENIAKSCKTSGEWVEMTTHRWTPQTISLLS